LLNHKIYKCVYPKWTYEWLSIEQEHNEEDMEWAMCLCISSKNK
jgi:hypothetical protein